MKGSLWRHGEKLDRIEPGEWPGRAGRARVLIEHPDPATLWAEAEAMRDAGYDVAICAGPTRASDRTSAPVACPLLVDGRCALVEYADVVVSTTDLGDSQRLLATLSRRTSPALVVEATKPTIDRGDYELGDATVVEVPVTEGTLLDAVADALRSEL
jgi:hypothetical protein